MDKKKIKKYFKKQERDLYQNFKVTLSTKTHFLNDYQKTMKDISKYEKLIDNKDYQYKENK